MNKPASRSVSPPTDRSPETDPITRAVLERLGQPYPDTEGRKEPLVLIGGRIPQELSDRLDLVVQHLDRRSKQEVLADAIRLYIAQLVRHQGRAK